MTFHSTGYIITSMSIKNLPSSYEIKKSFKHKLYGDILEVSHKKSGAKLVLIKNEDKARALSITFRTPPYDDTGIFHVFEHTVLAGSRLHPSKSNFFHVYNSSIASFINAMTGFRCGLLILLSHEVT